jgi:hypothetical protein
MMPPEQRAAVSIKTRPLWRIRLARDLLRYLLYALAVAGLAASARLAIAPPRGVAQNAVSAAPAPPDLAAEGYASMFARRYLTWNAADPQASQRALEGFAGPGMEADAGLQLPPTGEQGVEWEEVVQQREPAPGQYVYTVAAQTDTAGILYLTVSVVRAANGGIALGGYPALVGAPSSGPAELPQHLREVSDPALATVVERALRNYLAASAAELASDLTTDAHVSLPAAPLTLDTVQRLDWSAEGSAVLAVVQAQDSRGVRYTLAYELDVARAQGRWEISAVQTDPDE